MLRMKQVLMTDIRLMKITEENKLPKGYNKKAKELRVSIIVENDTNELIEETRRRDHFL